MKYITIADFGDYTVEQPLDDAYIIKERDRKRRRIKRNRKQVVDAVIASTLSTLFVVGMIVLYILMG